VQTAFAPRSGANGTGFQPVQRGMGILPMRDLGTKLVRGRTGVRHYERMNSTFMPLPYFATNLP